MNRPNFIATVAATLAAASLPQVPATAADASQIAEPIVYTTPMKMWRFSKSYPIVFAETEEDAISWAANGGCIDPEKDKPVLVQPDEHFTFAYEDGVPDHLQADEECECTPEEIADEFGCDCGAATDQVTMPAASWARDREIVGEVIYYEHDYEQGIY